MGDRQGESGDGPPDGLRHPLQGVVRDRKDGVGGTLASGWGPFSGGWPDGGGRRRDNLLGRNGAGDPGVGVDGTADGGMDAPGDHPSWMGGAAGDGGVQGEASTRRLGAADGRPRAECLYKPRGSPYRGVEVSADRTPPTWEAQFPSGCFPGASPAKRRAATPPRTQHNRLNLREKLERAMGFEPTTSTLARLRSTPELRPHRAPIIGPVDANARTVSAPPLGA